jgi:antitoxin (DNA-binding transcriptional repressor) of toxin-antitoxin stability system
MKMLKSIDEQLMADKLQEVLDSVSQGQQVTILRHGIPLAYLTPADAEEGRESEVARRAFENMKTIARRNSFEGLNIRELIEEGRRY